MSPINVTEVVIHTDSLICLRWLHAYAYKLDKQNNLSVFVKNRLGKIAELCRNDPIRFTFVDGFENPADHMSRVCSPRTLARSNYITGPKFLSEQDDNMSRLDIMEVTVPNPKFSSPAHGRRTRR